MFGRVLSYARRHPIVVDAALAAATLLVSLALAGQEPPPGRRPFDPAGFTLTVLACLTLVARRRHPLAVLVGYGAAWAVCVAADLSPVVTSAGAMLALYTVAAHRPPRAVLAAVAVLGAVWVYAGLRAGEDLPLTVASQAVVCPAVICWAGARTRRLTELAARLRQEQEQKETARRAVDEERLRAAAELHDIVADHMAVVSVQAGLAWYVFDSNRETCRTALQAVLETSGEAQEEMRRLLALLRQPPPTAPDTDAAGLG